MISTTSRKFFMKNTPTLVNRIRYPIKFTVILRTSWYPWNHGFHGIYPFVKTQDRDLGWACFICWSGSGYADSISWCSVIACPDWVHMFRGCARMREVIEDHQGILVRISQFPIDATQPSLNLRSKSESSCIFIAFVVFFCKKKQKQQEVSDLNKEFTLMVASLYKRYSVISVKLSRCKDLLSLSVTPGKEISEQCVYSAIFNFTQKCSNVGCLCYCLWHTFTENIQIKQGTNVFGEI